MIAVSLGHDVPLFDVAFPPFLHCKHMPDPTGAFTTGTLREPLSLDG